MRIAVLLCMLIATGAHAQPAEDPPRPLVWRGCEVSKAAFMGPCARAYQAKTGVEIRLAGGGAALGIAAVGARSADLGGTCRDCRPDERTLPIRLTVVAWDAIVAIVHADNPVDGLTSAQLKAVFQQQTTDWKDLGGRASRIVVTTRRSGARSGVGLMARRLIFGDDAAPFGARILRLPRHSGGLERFVSDQPRAIGFSGASSARQRKVKMLTVDGVAPTAANIASGKYPYFRPLYLTTHARAGKRVHAFRDWLVSPAGQAVIGKSGTVTLAQGMALVPRYKHFPTVGVTNLADLRERAGK